MNPDDVGRTLKLEMDDGRAETADDARRLVATYRLGFRLGEGFQDSRTATAAILTAINSAVRAYRPRPIPLSTADTIRASAVRFRGFVGL